jgi:toxin secretion/phage lysis holin
MEDKTMFLGTVTAVGTAVTTLLGGWDMGIKVLLLMVIVDYITGVIAAFIQKKLSSGVGFRGIVKKVSIFLLVAVAHAVDTITAQSIIRDATVLFFVANEGLSILENSNAIGLPIPRALVDAISALNQKEAQK